MSAVTTPESPTTESVRSGFSGRPQREFSWRPWMVVGLVAALLAAAVGVWKWVSADETGPPTYGEYDAAVSSAIAALLSSDGVQGTQLGYVGDRLSGAVWFESRPNGDWVVVQRQDLSVQGWPGSQVEPVAPPEMVTTIWVQVDDVLYEATIEPGQPQGAWTTLASEGGTRSFGLSLLERGDLRPTTESGVIALARASSGGEVWTLTVPFSDGEAVTQLHIDSDGTLMSYSYDLVGVSPQNLEFPFETSGEVRFTPLVDPVPIAAPDLSQPPDPALWGMPEDFGL